MRKVKRFTPEEIEQLNQEIVFAHEFWMKVWEIGMKGLRINSREYRRICKVGNDIQSVYSELQNIAEFKLPLSKVALFN